MFFFIIIVVGVGFVGFEVVLVVVKFGVCVWFFEMCLQKMIFVYCIVNFVEFVCLISFGGEGEMQSKGLL